MQVTLKRNITVDKIELKKGEKVNVKGIRFGGSTETYICNVGEHTMIPISKDDVVKEN